MRSTMWDVHGRKVFGVAASSGEPVLLLLHGYPQSASRWRHQIARWLTTIMSWHRTGPASAGLNRRRLHLRMTMKRIGLNDSCRAWGGNVLTCAPTITAASLDSVTPSATPSGCCDSLS